MAVKAKNRFPLIPAILALLILLCLAGGFRNYNALLNSDQYAYLTYGRGLARGGFAVEYPLLDILRERLPEGSHRPLFYGRRYYTDGEVISTLEPGFPLLLAAAIRLGGLPAAFSVNVILLAVFLIAYFLALRGEAPGSDLAALAAVFILLGWDNQIVIGYSLGLMRDIPPLAFFWLGLYLILRGLRPGRRGLSFLLPGAAAVIFSGLIRLTNLVLVIPPAIYVLIAVRGKGWGWGRIVLGTAAAAAVAGLVFLPQFLEEARFLGDPLAFARRALGAFQGFFHRGDGVSRHTFSLNNLRDNLPKNLNSIYYLVTLPGFFLLAAGVIACRRRLSTWLIMLPVPLINLLLFSSFGHRARRYRFPLYPFIAYFIAAGAIWVFNRWRGYQEGLSSPARKVAGLVGALAAGVVFTARFAGGAGLDYIGVFLLAFGLAALLSAASAPGSRWKPAPGVVFTAGTGLLLVPFFFGMVARGESFNWQDARRLRRELEKSVPAEAVILGERYLIQNVDAYTRVHGISPGNLAAPLGVELAEAVVIVEESGRPVFALDNRGYRSMESTIRYLGRYFDLEPVGRWRSEELKIRNPYYSNEETLTLFRVSRRTRTEAVLSLPTPERSDYLALLDIGFPPLPAGPASETRVRINDRELPVELGDGLNYVLIPAREVSVPETALEVAFHRPLPSDILRGLLPVENRFRVDFGVEKEIDDELFVDRGLYLDRLRLRNYRVMGPEAAVILPRLIPPESSGWLKLRVKNILPQSVPVNLAVRPENGRLYGRTIPATDEWQLIKFSWPALFPRQGSFLLTVFAEPAVSDPAVLEELAGSAFLAIDWLEIGWGGTFRTFGASVR